MNKPSSSAMAAARDCTDSAYGPDLRIQHPDLAEVHDRLFRTTLERHFIKHMQIPEGQIPEVTHYQGAFVKCTHYMRPIIDLDRHEGQFDIFLVRAEVKAAPPKRVGDHESTGATTGGKP